MIVDLLASNPGFAVELLERTADTPRVLRAVQLSLAPAFLLVGIGSIMNVMMTRLTWVAGRIERLSEEDEDDLSEARKAEFAWLCKRRDFARRAIKYSTGAAVVISVVIALLFISAYVETKLGTFVAVLWVITVGLLIAGLVVFLRETLLAANGPGKPRQGAENH